LLGDESPLVRGAAVWALGQLVARDAFEAMKSAAMSTERNESATLGATSSNAGCA